MDIGRRLERAIHQSSLVRRSLPEICRGSRNILEALLEAFDSIMTYRARYRTVFQPAPVLDLLLMDETNPKALAFQLSRLTAHVEQLPQQGEPSADGALQRTASEMLDALRRMHGNELRCGKEDPVSENLSVFLESMEIRLKQLAQQISSHYLTRVPSTPHFSSLSGDRRS
jgi:uncharacterized alpha-E superfamily protein